MTESEAIEIVRKEKAYMDSHAGRAQSEAFQMSINALEEVERYRNIGVISSYEMEQDLLLYKADREILNGYQELGTVEELKLAKEKQIPKRPNKNFEKFSGVWCSCGKYLGKGYFVDKQSYCSDCGQKLDWSDEE